MSVGTYGKGGGKIPSATGDVEQWDYDKIRSEQNIQRALRGTGTSQNEVPEQVLDVIGSGGMPLRPAIQRSLEDRMDASFSDVRIHTGAKAAQPTLSTRRRSPAGTISSLIRASTIPAVRKVSICSRTNSRTSNSKTAARRCR